MSGERGAGPDTTERAGTDALTLGNQRLAGLYPEILDTAESRARHHHADRVDREADRVAERTVNAEVEEPNPRS